MGLKNIVFRSVLPSWADFDIGRAPVYWKTMNGLPPSSVSLCHQLLLTSSMSIFNLYSVHVAKSTIFLSNLQGERVKLFYNPAASKLTPNKDFGIAFNGIFSTK